MKDVKDMSRRTFMGSVGKGVLFSLVVSYVMLTASTGTGILASELGAINISGTDHDPRIEGIQAVAQEEVSWLLEYVAGSQEIQPGGRIRIKLDRFHESRSSQIQTSNPAGLGYVTASTDGSCTLRCWTDSLKLVHIQILDLPLREGEKVFVVIGDTSQGSKGYRVGANSGRAIVAPLAEDWSFSPRIFQVAIAKAPSSNYIVLEDDSASFEVISAGPSCLELFVPSMARRGEPQRAVIRLTDKFGNLVESFAGFVALSSSDPGVVTALTPQDCGHKVLDDVVFNTLGLQTVRASVCGTSIWAESNPVECFSTMPDNVLFWGDLHGHTQLSDGRQTPDELFVYSRDISNLDFQASTDHTYHPPRARWVEDQTKPKVEEYNQPGVFSTILACEWSQFESSPDRYGHRNVYYRSMNGFFPASYFGDYDHADELFAALENYQAIVVPHHASWVNHPMLWEYHSPKLQRLAEIYSIHGLSEYQGNVRPVSGQVEGHNVQDALAMGHKLGIICSSDSHLTRPGLTTSFDIKNYRAGLVAVYAEENSREAIWDALYRRHCYGTTGERIILDFKINGSVMGSELALKTDTHPELYVKAIGTDILDTVEIVKGYIGRVLPFPTVHQVSPGTNALEFTWTDPAPSSDCFYYVRVTQADGEMAWSSPIWVSPSMRIRNITRDKSTGDVTIRWGCLPHRLYSVYYKDGMEDSWHLAQTDIPSSVSGEIEWTDDGTLTGTHPSAVPTRLYNVRADG